MRAVDALSVAQAAGIQVTIDGDDLILSAPAQPPDEVLDLLARFKESIVSLLCPGNGKLSCKDWQELFDERAGIGEFDGGLTRDQAEVQAFCYCMGEWLSRNQVTSESGCCEFCRLSTGTLLPYLTAYSVREPGHTWLHQECSQAWHQERRARALAALVAMGVAIPIKFGDDNNRDLRTDTDFYHVALTRTTHPKTISQLPIKKCLLPI